MLGKVFKAYDIRAIYPTPLSLNTAWKIGYGTGRYLATEAENVGATDPMMSYVVVGEDMRPSSPELADAVIDGIRHFGTNIIRVGLVDTSFIYFAVNHLDCAGGVMTTASHNPIEYNGFKLSGRRALPMGQDTGLVEVSKFAAMADETKIKTQAPPLGRIEERDLWDDYREHVLQFLDLNGRALKVVVDASNGMAGTMIPRIFKDVPGLEIVEINFDNSKGEFVHEPNPLVASNLDQTRQAVRAEKADFGICFDGDADRGIFVDEKGGIIGCDHLTGLLAKFFLAMYPGSPVVYDLRSSKAVGEEIEAAGGKAIRSRVGHVFMKQILREKDGCFGGELSGHFYFKDNFYADSGAIVFATMLTVLADSERKLSELIRPIARYAQSGEINFENDEKDEALEGLIERFHEEAEIDELDGVTVDCFEKEGWWFNVRKSNTEPLLRLNLETKDPLLVDQMVDELAPMLGKRVAH